jgi:WD40 repeat protein
MSVDGNNPQQITKDGADKQDLQWTPDGKSLTFISGKCIKSVTFPDGVVSQITCFNSSDFVESFEISPDGKLVAISVNHVLFIVPFDVAAISGAKSAGQLAIMPGGIFKYPDLTKQQSIKQVRWFNTGKRIAVDALTPNGSGQVIDAILIYDISSCTAATPCDTTTYFQTTIKDIFPGNRFSMVNFGVGGGKYSIIPAFDLNEEGLFLLNSITRNGFYGYLYSYNTTNTKSELVDPLGSQCCYTDALWSPDSSYVLFAYQDIRQGGGSKNQLFYISYGSIGTGAKFTPLPLPDNVLTNIGDHPAPALRPAK